MGSTVRLRLENVMRKYSGCLKLSQEYRRETELKIIANVKNDGMMMSKIKMFRISDELSSHISRVQTEETSGPRQRFAMWSHWGQWRARRENINFTTLYVLHLSGIERGLNHLVQTTFRNHFSLIKS